MPTTAAELFERCGLRIAGTVPWGVPVSSRACGVYVVSLSEDPNTNTSIRERAPISTKCIKEWIAKVQTIELDGFPATAEGIEKRLRKFWLADESVLYIGKAMPLRSRIDAYYRTPLGNRGPHSGGHWIKTLSVLNKTFVHYGEVADCEKSEGELLRIFAEGVSQPTRQRVGSPALPFANLELPDGQRKRRKLHRIGNCRLV